MGIWKVLTVIYTKMLEKSVENGKIPKHVMVVADTVHDSILDIVRWCEKFGVEEVTLCFSNLSNSSNSPILKQRRLSQTGRIKVNIVTLSGREEILNAVKKLAEMVERGELNPEDVNEDKLEAFLEVKSSPDLIIRAGDTIPDFLIWQSIYSELYFADVNWKNFRYVDFLRCLRDYQRRERRYGR